jgi:hypothetical protein
MKAGWDRIRQATDHSWSSYRGSVGCGILSAPSLPCCTRDYWISKIYDRLLYEHAAEDTSSRDYSWISWWESTFYIVSSLDCMCGCIQHSTACSMLVVGLGSALGQAKQSVGGAQLQSTTCNARQPEPKTEVRANACQGRALSWYRWVSVERVWFR